QAGVPANHIHSERFNTSGLVARPRHSGDRNAARVTILLDGRRLDIELGEQDDSILDAALRQGADLLAWRQGIAGFRLIIVGIAISAVLVSTNTWLIITASLERAMDAAMWQAGSLNGMTWQKAQPATAFIVLRRRRAVDGQTATAAGNGRRHARALGVNAESSRLWLMLFGVTLTAAVTATAGPISFIALARRKSPAAW
ncbi:iron chelate uptake ABC transporter family permease subunit, partial [Serratia ureilytica]|nr:iron chelate uptake ABC transporter family permease subunit [Serratia ureilytica]